MVTHAPNGRVRELTEAEARELFQERTHRRLQIDAEEFIRRWQAGEYGAADDNPDALELTMLLPLVGVDPWRDDHQT